MQSGYSKVGTAAEVKSSFTLFQTTKRVFVCQTPTKAFHVECLIPTVHRGSSMMVWGAIFWHGLGTLVILRGKITDEHYRIILADNFHPMPQPLFRGVRPVFQDDNTLLHMARCV